MKKIVIVSSFLTFGLSGSSQAQFTQLDLFSGIDKTNFSIYSSYAIHESKTFSIGSLAFFQKFHGSNNNNLDELGVQPTLFWDLHENISFGPSIYYNSNAGYSNRLSAKFTIKRSQLIIVFAPTLGLSSNTHNIYAEAFTQFQLNKPINGKISIWFNGQFLTVWDMFTIHTRSFQQVRLGISLFGHQFGLGLDLDQYGPHPLQKISIGLYYRKTI
ncbi:MAG: hypothetical protein NXI10_16820 [bacterium]|nr:hypothetical protein [bacterium]